MRFKEVQSCAVTFILVETLDVITHIVFKIISVYILIFGNNSLGTNITEITIEIGLMEFLRDLSFGSFRT